MSDRLVTFFESASRTLAVALVIALLATAGLWYALQRGSQRTITAYFTSSVGLYTANEVTIAGIPVGSVDDIVPQGNVVRVTLKVDNDAPVAADAQAVIVAPTLVSDRYVQLGPTYQGGPLMAAGAVIPVERTATPVELDRVYRSLDAIAQVLGPNAANQSGALNQLLRSSAGALGGNGELLKQTITELGGAVGTLADNRDNLFATVSNLQTLNVALNASENNIKHFEEMLATVSGDLAAERADLGAALHNLSVALAQVSAFVNDNADALHTDISGLKDITGVFAKDKAALDEILAVAPVALANLVHGYQEPTGTLGTRSNLTLGLQDPAKLCGFFDAVGLVTNGLLGPISGVVGDYCKSIADQTTIPVLPNTVQDKLKNVLPAIPGAS